MSIEEYNQVSDKYSMKLSEEYLEFHTSWDNKENVFDPKLNFINKYDFKFMEKYQKLISVIDDYIKFNVTNSENLMKSTKTMAELIGSDEYVKFKEHWFDF